MLPRFFVHEGLTNARGSIEYRHNMKDTQFPNVRCYDNAGRTADRFTAVFLDQPERSGGFAAIGMNHEPFHPQGIGMHCSAMPGRHLGKRIDSTQLNVDCQKLIRRDVEA